MNDDDKYRAISVRDKRFDGQFVAAIRTTGIYCRPSCPARTPKRENVEFYDASAAAHVAGYRACKRCLPEAVPGNPTWNIRQDVAARAMRLIATGLVDREGVDGLASALGYSQRQLNRILLNEVGAGTLALARAQRAHTARQLLVSTSMSTADVAFASGFGSIRQFNDTISEIFGHTPSQLRAAARTNEAVSTPGTITISLPVRQPFDCDGIMSWFAQRTVSGLDSVDGSVLRRTLRLENSAARISVRATPDSVTATIEAPQPNDLPQVIAIIRRMFDLDADPVAVANALRKDGRLARSVAAYPGIRIVGAADPYEMLVRAIVGQQISVAAARTRLGQLVDNLGDRLPEGFAPGDVDTLFPGPETMAERAHEVMRGPRSRTAALVAVSEAIASGQLSLGIERPLEHFVQALESFAGIGPWTSHYVALRVLQHPDILLTTDLVVRHGAAALGLGDSIRQIDEQARPFAPWRSYLTMHLWRAATDKD